MRVPWRSPCRITRTGFAGLWAAIAFITLNVATPAAHAQTWSPMATISATAALVTNSLCFTDGTDLVCNGTGGLATGNDRIVSGTTSVIAVSNTGYISLTTSGSTWGYFGNAMSYLPNFWAGSISTTNISATTINGVSISALGGGAVSTTTGKFITNSSNMLYDPVNGTSSTLIASHTATATTGAGINNILSSVALPATYTNAQVVAAGNFSTSSEASGTGDIYGLLANVTTTKSNQATGLQSLAIADETSTASDIFGAKIGAMSLASSTRSVGLQVMNMYSSKQSEALGLEIITMGTNTEPTEYGLRISSISNNDKIYGIYQTSLGPAMNYFESNVGIGTETPTTALEVNGTISATGLVINGVNITGGGGGGTSDRLTSGTTYVIINSATRVISLTTAGTTWGYFGSGQSYLPSLMATGVSATTISATNFILAPVSGSAGISMTGGDNLGNHTATQNLAMATYQILNAGKVAIGTSTPGTYGLYVTGDAYATGTFSTSDARFKENIHTMSGLLNDIEKLRPVTFTWKPGSMPAKTISGTQIGLIAQEVEKVYPELVKTNTDGYKAVAYDKLGVLLLGAVQELKTQNDDLRTQLNDLHREMDTIKRQRAH